LGRTYHLLGTYIHQILFVKIGRNKKLFLF